MKDGTRYASEVRKVFTKLRQQVSELEIRQPEDPIRRLAVATFNLECNEESARRAVNRLLGSMESWNEVRVSTPSELQRVIGNTIPNALARCQHLITSLQSVFDWENRLSLDRLKNVGRREARQYLEQLEGVDEYVAASVMLWGLGGHAIPVNDKLLEALRRAELVHPSANRAEVQAFLERNISATQAQEFCLVMRSFDGREASVAKRGKTAARSKNVRTTKR